ncbi:MAG: hypothetical protein P1V20_11215 [Verrucomicrobiales bacterium]|nr:hypothetical protein [Verrucomicrobiales bacterium]
MKRFVAFLIIALILGSAGYFLLGAFLNPGTTKSMAEPPLSGAVPAPAPAPRNSVSKYAFESAPVKRATSSFTDANIAFQTPGRMQVGKSRDVKLVLNLRKTIEELREELGKEFPTQGATIEASPIMEASLSGGSFDIRAASPVRQAIRDNADTTWEWSVVPREKGEHLLKLRLYAIVTLQGTAAPMEVKTFERDISVDVSIQELVLGFVKDNIQLVWLVLVVPVAGFLSRMFKGGKS